MRIRLERDLVGSGLRKGEVHRVLAHGEEQIQGAGFAPNFIEWVILDEGGSPVGVGAREASIVEDEIDP